MSTREELSETEKLMEELAVTTSNVEPPAGSLKEKIQNLWKKYQEAADKAPAQDSLNWAFESLPVALFPPLPRKEVIEIQSDASIAETVMMLAQHQILSAPVRNVDAPEDGSWMDRYLGMVDFAGIITWVLEQANVIATGILASATGAGMLAGGLAAAAGAAALGATGVGAPLGMAMAGAVMGGAAAGGAAVMGPGRSGPAAASAMGEEFFKVLQESELFHKTKVADITGSFRWAPFLPVQPEDSFLTVLLLVSKYRLRSVPVVESGGSDIKNFITQSAIVRVLADCQGAEWFDRIALQPLSAVGLPTMAPSSVIKIEEDRPVLEAFTLLVKCNIGGVPVVAEGGKKVVANISARNMALLLTDSEIFRQRSSMTVRDFIEQAQVPHGTTNNVAPQMSPAITCTAKATLADVISLLSRSHIHRIYVVNEAGDLSGVVTLRDIIGKFVNEPDDYFGTYFVDVTPASPVSADKTEKSS